MSSEAVGAVYVKSKMRGLPFLVLVQIADCSDQDGRCEYLSSNEIALMMRLTRPQVLRCLRVLEKSGELIVSHQIGYASTFVIQARAEEIRA